MSLIDKLVQIDGSKEELTSNLQKKYSRLAKAGDMFGVDKLFRQTKVVPELSDLELATLYISSTKQYASAYQLRQIIEWDKKVHDGKSLVFKSLGDDFAEALQEGYFTLIRDNGFDKEGFQELKKLTGIPVTEETVQNAFNQRIKNKVVLGDHEFDKVEKATGIRPKADEKVVQDLYKDCLEREKTEGQGLYFWQYLAKATKIMPEEETAQSAFRYFVERRNTFDLIRFAEFTNITPEEKTVKDAYRVLAEKRRFTNSYEDLKKVSGGVEPDKETVQHAYKTILDHKDSIWNFYFKRIKELTGINPPKNFVQEAYMECINKGEFEHFEELYDTFKIEPSKTVGKALTEYLVSK